ncbi:hypothetical protein [Aliidiomarina sanyensis]|uniref:Uncharacterized protein n=1 Tax=Aliidiomarina sanyensis TaxID=1249555 RepID=A0A432WFY5_9GAMM|nr:hypothetical protein [Aliidiomarina sanyensis]RUO32651.1 hypothetical protein CWE11_07690 [Aliidiomarina sanyensis]
MRRIAPFILTCLLTACATTSPQERELTQLTTHYETLDAIWDSYRPSERILGIYDSSGTITVATGRPEVRGFTRLDSGLWQYQNPNVDLQASFYINRSLNNERMTLVRQTSERDRIPFLIHEDFHGHQRAVFHDNSGSTLTNAYTGEMPIPELIASIRLERNLLMSAIEAPTELDRVRALAAYIGLREWRAGQLPESFLNAENRTERIEGSAHWVELHASARIQGSDSIQSELITALSRDMESISGDLSVSLLATRLYPTGAALLELANTLNIDAWQQRISEGTSPYALIRAQINLSPEQLESFQADMIESPVFAREVERAQSMQFGPAGESVYQSFQQRYRHEVRFFIPASFDEQGEAIDKSNFTTSQAAPFSQGVAMDPVDRFTLEGPAANIQVTRAPFIFWRESTKERDGESIPGTSFSIFTDQIRIAGEEVGVGEHVVTADDIQIRRANFSGTQRIYIEIK